MVTTAGSVSNIDSVGLYDTTEYTVQYKQKCFTSAKLIGVTVLFS